MTRTMRNARAVTGLLVVGALATMGVLTARKLSRSPSLLTEAESAAIRAQGQGARPSNGQRRAPCDAGQEELSGSCWLRVESPGGRCPSPAVMADGRCYMPVLAPQQHAN